MDERFQYAEVRQRLIDALKTDLMGPQNIDEVLDENPMFAYIIGMLYPQTNSSADGVDVGEQEVEADIAYEDGEDYTSGEEDDNEPIAATKFKQQSSIGISFYVEASTPSINLDVSWGDYVKTTEKKLNKDGKEIDVAAYKRHKMEETLHIVFSDIDRTKDYSLVIDSNVTVHVSKITLKRGFYLVTAYVINRRPSAESALESIMFQVNLRAYAEDQRGVFIAEHICRKVLASDEFYFEQRPIMGRGRGCAATWDTPADGKCSELSTDFIPQYEFPGVSAALKGFDKFYFSMRFLSIANKREQIIERLNTLANSYEQWIEEKLVDDPKMSDPAFVSEIGNSVISKCKDALARIREGIHLLVTDDLGNL